MADRKNTADGAGKRGTGAFSRTCLVASISLLLALFSSVSEAKKPVIEETFEGKKASVRSQGGKVEATPFGKGWSSPSPRNPAHDPAASNYIAYDAGRLDPEKGTISFRFKRGNQYRREPGFSFVDNNFNGVINVTIAWDQRFPALVVQADGPPRNVWMMRRTWDEPAFRNHLSPTIRLPEIQPGQWVHFAFTWGPTAADHAIYVDGKKLAVELGGASDIPSLIRRSSYLVFGGRPKGKGSDVTNTMMTSAIAGIRMYDVPVNAFALSGDVPVISSVTDDSFKVPGISGKLVAGDKVSVTLIAAPGGKASFDMGKARGIPLEEVPPRAAAPGIPAVDNGTYQGRYTIRPGEDFENGQIVGNFVSSDNVAADNVTSALKWTIDTKPKVTFRIDRKDLPADSASKARVKLAAVDANGNPVKGRHLKLTLATTDEYTGTVGAGDFGKQVGATVETRWKGETDSWGEVEFDYTAGFAAKTVILTAKDLDSGGVSVDYITAFKEASIDIALTQPVNRAAARRGMQYILKVEASRTELTADGRSRSVIRATLSDPNGVGVAGDPVAFTLSSQNGTLRTIEGKTNASGVATAEYTAGKKIGIVVVTATATLRNATGNVSIILLSDAPAKIYLKAKPDSLPADGFSRADLSVKVTDINDNPNKDTKVEFKIARGGGKLEYPDRVTDKFGDTQNRYTSGTTPGVASVTATVRSKVPTESELSKARNVLFVPYNPGNDEIRVERWLKKKGDAVLAGEPVLEYTVGRSKEVKVLPAPYDLTVDRIEVEYWDRAEVGQTLAIVTRTVK